MLKRHHFWTLILFALLLTSCTPGANSPTPGMDTVGTAVAAALTAIPSLAAPTPFPTYTPYPTTDLGGLFCEYDFCIAHPPDMPFFDLEVVNDYTTNRSEYAQGNLITFNETLYIFLVWSQQAGEFDPASMLTLVLNLDTPQDLRFTENMNGYDVVYVWLASTPSTSVVPYGLAAAWRCGDRAFGWKVYTQQDGQGREYLWQAMSRFKCSE